MMALFSKRCVLRLIAFFLLPQMVLAPIFAVAPDDPDEAQNISIYEQAAKAVVTIYGESEGKPSGGAGVLIQPGGLILTSRHVVGNARYLRVSLSDGRRCRAEVLKRMAGKIDLAFVRCKIPGETFPALELGDSDALKVGQKVLAIGNPYGFERTMTLGIISRLDSQRRRIQTDAAINPGNSGGPLLDRQGDVIGVNQSLYNPDGNHSNVGIGFAVPINLVKPFLHDLEAEMRKPRSEPSTKDGKLF